MPPAGLAWTRGGSPRTGRPPAPAGFPPTTKPAAAPKPPTPRPIPRGEFAVNTYTAGDQYAPNVAADPAGDFVITWASGSVGITGQDGSGFGIYARRYDAAGGPKDLIEQRVNTFVVGDQLYPAVAIDA